MSEEKIGTYLLIYQRKSIINPIFGVHASDYLWDKKYQMFYLPKGWAGVDVAGGAKNKQKQLPVNKNSQ